MSREEIIARLRANIDKVVPVAFSEDARNPLTRVDNWWPSPDDEALMRAGRVKRMTIHSVDDDEGFVNQVNDELFGRRLTTLKTWSRWIGKS